MKKLIILSLFLFSFVYADVEIIATKSCKVEVLSKSDVKKLFMLKKTLINREKIHVIDSSNEELYNEFIVQYLNKSLRKMKTYWVRMLFTGKKIPPKKLSIDELVTTNDKDGCHLSYVQSESDTPKDWKTLTIK